MIALPVRVLLRCGELVEIRSQIEIGNPALPERMLTGITQSGAFDLWFAPGGRWRESGEPHARDIVDFVNPDGTLRPLTKEFQL